MANLLRSGGVAVDDVLRSRFPAIDEAYAAAVDAIQRRRLRGGKFTYRGMCLAVEITTLGRVCVLDGRTRAPIIAGALDE